jgi:hypothetical protein
LSAAVNDACTPRGFCSTALLSKCELTLGRVMALLMLVDGLHVRFAQCQLPAMRTALQWPVERDRPIDRR